MSSVADFLWQGATHMLGGLDHILFIAGVVLLASSLSRGAKLISVFVIGHSLTLLIATLAGWRVDPTPVDVVIALSVAYIGYRNLRGPPERWGPTVTAIFAFGLVHGLGLATRLQDLGLPPDGWALVGRVLAFNVGVEIGQVAALGAMVGAGLLIRGLIREQNEARRAFAVALIAAGLLGAIALPLLPGA
jgi:hydrogenase/urease accessory protein HupE